MRFIDVHSDMQGIDQEMFNTAHRMDAQFEQEEDVHFLHAWADAKAGKVFCLSEGPNKEAVLRVHERAGHPASEIYEVSIESD